MRDLDVYMDGMVAGEIVQADTGKNDVYLRQCIPSFTWRNPSFSVDASRTSTAYAEGCRALLEHVGADAIGVTARERFGGDPFFGKLSDSIAEYASRRGWMALA